MRGYTGASEFLLLTEFCRTSGLLNHPQCHVDEQRHNFPRLPNINPQICIKYVEDRVGVSLIFVCVAFLFCVGVSTLVCPVKNDIGHVFRVIFTPGTSKVGFTLFST